MTHDHSQHPHWRNLSIEKTLAHFGIDPTIGVPQYELLARAAEFGWNKIPDPALPSLFAIWIRQFKSPLIGILLIVAVVMLFFEHYSDAVVIGIVLSINSIIGTFHEARAQKTVRALRKLAPQHALVRRDGKIISVAAHTIVPGDILILTEGEKIIADARLLKTKFLRVNESMLTGESLPVTKDAHAKSVSHDPLDAPMLVYAGTAIIHGSGEAIVVATGVRTRLGAISAGVRESRTPIPLERDLKILSHLVIVAILSLLIIVFLIGLNSNLPYQEMLYISVALAVSAIPEGLPAVLTIILATGMWRMAKRNALIKKLFAVEALGQVHVLALDKTGTLTFNEMMVTEIHSLSRTLRITGDGYKPLGLFYIKDHLVAQKDILDFQKIVSLLPPTIQAQMYDDGTRTSGDPTEIAMLVLSQKMNSAKPFATRQFFPFDNEKKYAFAETSIKEPFAYAIVGAPEAVLATCSSVRDGDVVKTLSTVEHNALAAELHLMAEKGLRVVAVASKVTALSEWNPMQPTGFIFEAFLGLTDAVRPEAARMIAAAKGAGVRVVMVTGDLPATARTIAQQVGIFERGNTILTGKELHDLSEHELSALLPHISVFARVSPEDKLRIIELYQKMGHSVAMTGDGVNDAPSLVKADLGIAMARSGTDVARQAADILLLNDNLESIVAAIDEGRTMYTTIRKVLVYLFASNFGEICLITAALVLNIPLPITAIQIIWLNFVTDTFLNVGLALEPKEEKGMHPKLKRTKYFLRIQDIGGFLAIGVLMTVGVLWIFTRHPEFTLEQKRTAALITVAAFHWMHAWMCRTEVRSFFNTSLLRNKYLIGATVIVFALQISAAYVPALQKILGTQSIPVYIWFEATLISSSLIILEEARKWYRRRNPFK